MGALVEQATDDPDQHNDMILHSMQIGALSGYAAHQPVEHIIDHLTPPLPPPHDRTGTP